MNIDLCIVATRRPDLLKQTLASFNEFMFLNFNIRNVFMNLDPLWGNESDALECVQILRSYFSDAHVFQPQMAGYAAAVQRLWLASDSSFILHLEDDWILLEPIYDNILSLIDNKTKQICFKCKEKSWDINQRGHFHYRRTRKSIFGLRLPGPRMACFSVSPSIIDGHFARLWAKGMNLALDPEKQIHPNINFELYRTLKRYKVRLHAGTHHEDIMVDIGRQWRDERFIVKKNENGTVLWSSQSGGCSR